MMTAENAKPDVEYSSTRPGPLSAQWAQERGWGPWSHTIYLGLLWSAFMATVPQGIFFLFGDREKFFRRFETIDDVVIHVTVWVVTGLLWSVLSNGETRARWPSGIGRR